MSIFSKVKSLFTKQKMPASITYTMDKHDKRYRDLVEMLKPHTEGKGTKRKVTPSMRRKKRKAQKKARRANR